MSLGAVPASFPEVTEVIGDSKSDTSRSSTYAPKPFNEENLSWTLESELYESLGISGFIQPTVANTPPNLNFKEWLQMQSNNFLLDNDSSDRSRTQFFDVANPSGTEVFTFVHAPLHGPDFILGALYGGLKSLPHWSSETLCCSLR